MILINTFSPTMIKSSFSAFFEEISKNEAYSFLRKEGFVSAISSKEVAFLFGAQLQLPIGVNNLNISLTSGDQAILGLYKGPKIRKRQSRLSSGASIKWYLITIDGV